LPGERGKRRDGLPRDEAMRKAGPVRLRPILMTTFAMIFGMLPSALSRGEGSESQSPMAVAIIGGLISSTFLTLIIVPVVYSLIDPLSEWFNRTILRNHTIHKEGTALPEAKPEGQSLESIKI
jgi:HAE1 family hydrophobic/amphiphilic exporter-1